MNAFWSQHLRKDADQQKDFEGFVRNSKPVLDRAIEYIHHKANSVYPASKDYNTPNWDYLQADRNGYLRALAELETFLDITNDNNNKRVKQTWLTKTNQQLPKKQPTFFNRLKASLLKLKQRIW